MEVEKIIERLQRLSQNLSDKIQLEEQLSALQEKLQHEKARRPVKLNRFDSKNKEKFINENVGKKPDKPNKTLAILVPVYIKKKKEYESALEKYNAERQIAEKEYYKKFESERQELIAAENKEREKAIQNYSLSIDSTKEKLSFVTCQIENDDIIGNSNKNLLDIPLLIEIFDNKRADSIKEAVNVLFEDKHRKRMEELQRESVRLTNEAKAVAERAEKCADDATIIAKKALQLAEDAYKNAQDACSEAQDACNVARATYVEVIRN